MKTIKIKIEQLTTSNELFSFESKEINATKLTNEQIALNFGKSIFETINHFKTSKTKMYVNGYEFKPSKPFHLYLNVNGNDYNLDEFVNFFSFDKQLIKLGNVGIKENKINLGRYDILVMNILKILKGIDNKSLLISNKDIETIKLSIANNVKLLA
jgi:hypothetical protein